MKLKYIAIFALAFAICAGWNLLFDAPKTANLPSRRRPSSKKKRNRREAGRHRCGRWKSGFIRTCTSTKLWTTRSRKSPST